MVKDEQTVISEFNELVNMSAIELEDWLKEEQSTSSGWSKDDGSGETIGHESGRKIIEILKKNPSKDLEKYDEGIYEAVIIQQSPGQKKSSLMGSTDDIPHIREVVSYCKRHLAQEEKAKQDTNSKSYRSLKNWGHDAQKA